MTLKQIKASKETLVNGGNITKAMLKVGYSPATANNPRNLTKSKAYQEIVVPKLKAAGITLDKYINNIGDAMKADKTVITGKGDDAFVDVVPDHMMRLAANKQAEKLLRIDALVGVTDNTDGLEPEDLQALASASDEIELTRVLFKKNK